MTLKKGDRFLTGDQGIVLMVEVLGTLGPNWADVKIYLGPEVSWRVYAPLPLPEDFLLVAGPAPEGPPLCDIGPAPVRNVAQCNSCERTIQLTRGGALPSGSGWRKKVFTYACPMHGSPVNR